MPPKMRYFLASVYWHVFKPNTLGVRVILVSGDKVLLVKHRYLKDYYFPGGGVSSGEMVTDAAIREVKEETGLDISQDKLKLFGVYQSNNEGKRDTEILFLAHVSQQNDLSIDRNEIASIKWFSLNKTIVEASPATKRRIEEYKSKKYPFVGRW